MCCFSRPVKEVSSTNIFARSDGSHRQFIVYSMSIETQADVAMILPLPVKLPAGENDVKFIALKDCPEFFERLSSGFPTLKVSRGFSILSNGIATDALPVMQVGDFEASFVPTMKDFSRLDDRFRIAPDVWKKLPGYDDYGFAVFKLKPGTAHIHPMAFSFPRRDNSRLFFPTVHIHDGQVHGEAEFDHNLYCQRNDDDLNLLDWTNRAATPPASCPSTKPKSSSPPTNTATRVISGVRPNRDTWLTSAAGSLTPNPRKLFRERHLKFVVAKATNLPVQRSGNSGPIPIPSRSNQRCPKQNGRSKVRSEDSYLFVHLALAPAAQVLTAFVAALSLLFDFCILPD